MLGLLCCVRAGVLLRAWGKTLSWGAGGREDISWHAWGGELVIAWEGGWSSGRIQKWEDSVDRQEGQPLLLMSAPYPWAII